MLKHGRYDEAIKRAPAKLAERFGAYNGHPYPFMLLPPTFHCGRRGRPYNTLVRIEFNEKKKKKERTEEEEQFQRNIDITRYIYQSSLVLQR